MLLFDLFQIKHCLVTPEFYLLSHSWTTPSFDSLYVRLLYPHLVTQIIFASFFFYILYFDNIFATLRTWKAFQVKLWLIYWDCNYIPMLKKEEKDNLI